MPLNNTKKIADDLVNTNNAILRTVKNENSEIYITYIRHITDIELLVKGIIQPIVNYQNYVKGEINSQIAVDTVLGVDQIEFIDDEEELKRKVKDGMSAVMFSNDSRALIINTKKIESKSVDSPELSYSIWGAKDAFTENLDKNLSLIRYRIKDDSLKLEMYKVGRRTDSTLLMAYISDIVNEEYVKTIQKRISKIDVDGMLESTYLQSYLSDKKFSLFPQVGLEQRSDIACNAMLEGKIIILIEGSGIALILPKVLAEFLYTNDDEGENIYFAVFTKFLRLLALFLSLSITAWYVALATYHAEALPPSYMMIIASGRFGVPFSVALEALILELLVEILRESLLRAPQQIGSAIGIVGGIVIGQAIVSAGLFSPVILVVASLSVMCSFIAPDYTITGSIRVLKFTLIILTAFFGIIGLAGGLFVILFSLVSDTSVSTPYMAPYAPFDAFEVGQSIFANKYAKIYRPGFLTPRNKIRQKKQ